MAAEWNHCLSKGGTEALLAVTQTEYKLRYAPRAPTFIVETCEQGLWKKKKRKSTQRSRMKPPMCWFFFLVCDMKKYLWSLIIFLGGGVRVHRWIKSCLMRQLSRCQNSSNYSGVHERQKKTRAKKHTGHYSYTLVRPSAEKLASVIVEAQRCVCAQGAALEQKARFHFGFQHVSPLSLSCEGFVRMCHKTKCTQVKGRKKRSSALISAWTTPQGQQQRKIANSVLLIKWRLGEIWNPSLDADDVFSPQHCGEVMWRYHNKYCLSFSMRNARAKVSHSDGEMASPYTHKQLRTYEPSENGTNFMARPPFSLFLSLVTRLIKLLFISPIN